MSDKQVIDNLKNGTRNGKKNPKSQGVKDAGDSINNFIEESSDIAGAQIADTITARSLEKAMALLGKGYGARTTEVLNNFRSSWCGYFEDELPTLAGGDEDEEAPKYLPASEN